ncbi:hypothetical protein HaLaN_28540, partial [Haematococcus lacustris]
MHALTISPAPATPRYCHTTYSICGQRCDKLSNAQHGTAVFSRLTSDGRLAIARYGLGRRHLLRMAQRQAGLRAEADGGSGLDIQQAPRCSAQKLQCPAL